MRITQSVSPGICATFFLLTAALIWGGTFVIVKISLETIPPFSFIFGRFAIAFLLLVIFSHRKIKMDWRSHLQSSTFLGLILVAGFILQVWGLQRTSASDAGFITGISAVLVVVLDLLVNKHWSGLRGLLGFASAVVGLAVLSFGKGQVSSIGNLLVLGCAVAFGLHVFYTDRYSKHFDASVLTTEQIGVVIVVTLFGALANREFAFTPSSYAIFGLLYSGVLATALAYLLQTWGQRLVQATHSAIVLAAEPVFAAALAVGFLAEPITFQLVLGGILVTFGMILSLLRP